jgi:hypothetical protein
MLENKKLMSEIERNMARAGEDQVDITLKQNKAAVEAAKARALNSKADLDDLSFVSKDEEIDHLQKMEIENMKMKHQMEMMNLQAAMGDKNIGVPR